MTANYPNRTVDDLSELKRALSRAYKVVREDVAEAYTSRLWDAYERQTWARGSEHKNERSR